MAIQIHYSKVTSFTLTGTNLCYVISTMASDASPDPPIKATDLDSMRRYVEKHENTEVEASGNITWEIDSWDVLPEVVESPVQTIGGHAWKLLLYPNGNPDSGQYGYTSLYLKCVDEGFGWSACASFALIMYNTQHPDVFIAQSTSFRFRHDIVDWGWGGFTQLRRAFVAQPDESAPLIQGKVTVCALIDLLADPTNTLWLDDASGDYNSRAITGYTGLMNQGATCYLNSMLQTLFFTKSFRSAVYRAEPIGLVPSLQRLFCLLSMSPNPVETDPLTKALGWDAAYLREQQDVAESTRTIMDKLEKSMTANGGKNPLRDIFVGQINSVIKCINVPYESSNKEEFWDLQLNVKGSKDVYESFRQFTAFEILDGDNKYDAPGYGLQAVKKGYEFARLPPVLHLQLKRYELVYDEVLDRIVTEKLDDRYEFPLELNLDEFVKEPGSWKYNLHGVLVHDGQASVGHYYALIKPEADGKWYKFNDDIVTEASLKEVLDANYGGETSASAYMLVYIRQSELSFVLPKSNPAPPQQLAAEIEQEQQKEIERLSWLNVRILTPDNFRAHSGLGIHMWSTRLGPYKGDPSEFPDERRVHRNSTIRDFKLELAESYKTGEGLSLWLFAPKLDQLVPIPLQYEFYGVEKLSTWSEVSNPLVFVQDVAGSIESEVLVFVKQHPGFRGLGTQWLSRNDTLGHALLKGRNGLQVFLEQRNALTLLDMDKTIRELDLQQAASLVVASSPGTEEEFNWLRHDVLLYLHHPEQPQTPDVAIVNTLNPTYEEIARATAKAAGISDPRRVMLHPPQIRTWLKSDGSNLGRFLSTRYQDRPLRCYIKELDRPLSEFEQLREFEIEWPTLGSGKRQEWAGPSSVVAMPTDTFRLVLDQVPDSRLWIVTSSRKAEEISPDSSVEQFMKMNSPLYARKLLPEEPLESYISIFAFDSGSTSTHGIPFTMGFSNGETVGVLRNRLSAALGRNKLGRLVHYVSETEPELLSDATILNTAQGAVLGVEISPIYID